MKAITIVIMDNSGNSHTKTMTSEDDIFSVNVMPLGEDTEPEKPERKITFYEELLEWLDELESSELDAKVGSEKDSDFYWEHRGAQLAYEKVQHHLKMRKNLVDEGVAGPEKPPRKIDHVCFQGWHLVKGRVMDYKNWNVNAGAAVATRSMRTQLIVNAPATMRALIRYVDDYRAGKEITERFADEFTKIITESGFECDLR